MQKPYAPVLQHVACGVAWLWACVLTLPTPLLHAAAVPGVPATAATIAAFVPPGFVVESTVEGDLDGDAFKDVVVVLVEKDAPADEPADDARRALLVLTGKKQGFTLRGSNPGWTPDGTMELLACYECLGVKGGFAAPDITVKQRVVVVRQDGGSTLYYGATHRFRLAKDGKVRLIGVDYISGNALGGAFSHRSVNLLTGQHVTTRGTHDADSPEPDTTTKAHRPLKPLLALEDVTDPFSTPFSGTKH